MSWIYRFVTVFHSRAVESCLSLLALQLICAVFCVRRRRSPGILALPCLGFGEGVILMLDLSLLNQRVFMCYLVPVHKVPGGNSGPKSEPAERAHNKFYKSRESHLSTLLYIVSSSAQHFPPVPPAPLGRPRPPGADRSRLDSSKANAPPWYFSAARPRDRSGETTAHRDLLRGC